MPKRFDFGYGKIDTITTCNILPLRPSEDEPLALDDNRTIENTPPLFYTI